MTLPDAKVYRRPEVVAHYAEYDEEPGAIRLKGGIDIHTTNIETVFRVLAIVNRSRRNYAEWLKNVWYHYSNTPP